jgi:hypothetical protein
VTDVRSVTASSQNLVFLEPLVETLILADEASQVRIPCFDLEVRELKSSRLEIVLPHDEGTLGGFRVIPK